MINLALKSGYSFRECFGHLDKTILNYKENNVIGIADNANSFAHYYLEKESEKDENLKVIFAVRLLVSKDGTIKEKPRGQFGFEYIFLAKNEIGLKEIYNLIKINYENFYYRGNLSFSDVTELSDNVVVIAENVKDTNRLDYIAITTTTPSHMIEIGVEENIPFVSIINNFYPEENDRGIYELFVGQRNMCNQTYPQWIMNDEEWFGFQSQVKNIDDDILFSAMENTYLIADQITKFKLPRAPMIKAKMKSTIEYLCKIGAKNKGIDLVSGEYADRYNHELKIVKEKEFDDYFLVVADMIEKAKKTMYVGAARGSSAGSLICYLLSITEIDPIKYGLMFSRFIDISRSDLPDIDIDFPDVSRDKVIKRLIKDYGEPKVKNIANISKLKGRSAIGNFAKNLKINIGDSETVKDALIERFSGSEGANNCVHDTFDEIQIGIDFVKKYPAMRLAGYIEGHPDHSSTHAAGIIVCNEDVSNYGGINARDNTIMLDKKGSEHQNLLKIDVLGLRTLSVLQECAELIGMDYNEYYTMELDDKKTYKLLTDVRVDGIFQFEGGALKDLTKKMGVENFNDIVALTALARPGALHSGGAARYIKYRLGEEKPIYIGELHKEITKETFGILVYQEQLMMICDQIGKMSEVDVNAIRKAFSKSLGDEYFAQYKDKFIDGAKQNGYSKSDADFLWSEMEYAGSYLFNKSHSVAYAMISYQTAYMKANNPLEFVVACLNNAKDEETSIRTLRDAVEIDGIKYDPLDPDKSMIKWSVSGDKIIGGLTSIKGIGVTKARTIIKARNDEVELTPSLFKALINPVTPFDNLFLCNTYFKNIYENPNDYDLERSPKLIKNVHGKGMHLFIGKLIKMNVKDLNEHSLVEKRDGKYFKDNKLSLSLQFEDDTDTILCSVDRFAYDDLAIDLVENGKVDEDYYLIMGEIWKEGSRFISVKNIMLLDKYGYGYKKENFYGLLSEDL